MSESLLPMVAVKLRVGLSASMIYREVAAGKFPKPGKYGTRSLWIESEIAAWIAERIARRNMGRNMGQDVAA